MLALLLGILALIDTNATPETQQLYNLLVTNYGEKIISGVVANVDWNTREAENVYQWTGHYPALNTFDFCNMHASKDVNPDGWLNYSNISVVEDWHKAGGIVGCMWHWNVRANNGVDMTCSPGNAPTETSFDASCVNDPCSAGYAQLVRDIAQVAGYLKKMQNAGIPVIWRPLHEASGNTFEYTGGKAWFWWGAQGEEVYKQLWRFLYNQLTNVHGLHNLIWVWTSQVNDSTWYPGDEYVDIIGRDSYYALQYPLAYDFRLLQQTYPNKLITLAECGNGDDVNMSPLGGIWNEGSRYSWFMTWYDYDYNKGTSDTHKFADAAWWIEAFSHDYVIKRDDLQ